MAFDINNGKYLLDSNSFIRPSRSYYKLNIVPSYWKWLSNQQGAGLVIPKIVFNELNQGQDPLSLWVQSNLKGIVFKDYEQSLKFWNVYSAIINFVQTSGYYRNPGIDEWMKQTKADPQIIAIAKVYGLKIVTFEQSAGKLNKKNPVKKEPKIPDVAKQFEVKYIDLFQLEKELNMVL